MKRWMALALVAGAALAVALVLRGTRTWVDVSVFQRHVSPGRLSTAHASLETNCAACHTAVRSAEPAKCIACHANNTALLQRQPTVFHATIETCSACHAEHRGATVRPVAMDHVTLADLGFEIVRRDAENPSNRRLLAWLRQHDASATVPTHPRVTPTEAALNCATCHATKDQHQKLFGEDCASCHATASWTISDFVHPSARSTDCAQCHRAPPSHYMMHFQMVSQAVARVTDARVDQCFRCHQTTSWNDIKGIGWYKHH
jgi:hypothetical protein